MELTRKDLLRLLSGSAAAAVGTVGADVPTGGRPRGESELPEVRRDVCVIGGGASGTYTAVRLRDLGRSVTVVEHQDRLGGHCETFHDPVTGGTLDIGVIIFHDLPLVRDFFARFNVPLAPYLGSGGSIEYMDFRSGRVVAGYEPPVPTALPAYYELLQQFPYLDDGFDLPDPVPETLLQPFGDLVRERALTSAVPLLFEYAQGFGDLLAKPSLYVMKNLGREVIQGVLSRSFLTTAQADTSALYERATSFLGEDVLLRSHVLATRRDRDGIRVRVATPQGRRTVRCRRLVVTIPPLPRQLAGVDLDRTERAVFGRFRHEQYWTGVLRLSGLPDGLTLQNTGADTLYHLPPLPGPYAIWATRLPGLWEVKYGTTRRLTDAHVRAAIETSIARIRTAGTHPVRLERVEILKGHNPYELTVPVRDIAAGFYRHLYALQGRNRTYYTGAAWCTHDSSLLWRFTEQLLPELAG